MTVKKIVLAGGTGFVGKYLEKQFLQQGCDVVIISRQNHHINWKDKDAVVHAINNSELVINLAGKSVDCRYNKKNREAILNSRTETTKAIGEAILKCSNPPEMWINSSTATIYRNSEDKPMTESSGEIGDGFSVNVAKTWEKSFFDFKLPNTRQAVLRISIVLGKNGGAIKPLTNLVRFGLGGKQGNGKQMFSWIHMYDLYKIITHIQQHKELKGVFNCASPHAIDNNTFMKTLRKRLHILIGIPSPTFLLEIGAFVIKTETELILKSRWVYPESLLNSGFKFEYPEIEGALNNILTSK